MPRGQITRDERTQIEHLLDQTLLPADIAEELRRPLSTITREVGRNADPDGIYRAASAHAKARARKAAANGLRRKVVGPLEAQVRRDLSKFMTAERLAIQLRRRSRKAGCRVSTATLYRFIERDRKQGGDLWKRLPSSWRRRRIRRRKSLEKRGKIKDRVGIECRPKAADLRLRFGDWEGDTIAGKKGRSALVSLRCRKSRKVLLAKVKDTKAATVQRAVCRLLQPLPRQLRRTTTLDNGHEFATHTHISKKLNMPIFFADAYSAQQRGTNENGNGLVRRQYPKGTDFDLVSNAQIAKLANTINNTPLKVLNHRSPDQVLKQRFPRLRFG